MTQYHQVYLHAPGARNTKLVKQKDAEMEQLKKEMQDKMEETKKKAKEDIEHAEAQEVQREGERIMERAEWENKMRAREQKLEENEELFKKQKMLLEFNKKDLKTIRLQAKQKARVIQAAWGMEVDFYQKLDAYNEGWAEGKEDRQEEEKRISLMRVKEEFC